VSFGPWLPLDGAAAPDGPGCLQVRAGQGAAGLYDYPRGRSAMVYYGASDERVADALARFREQLPPGERASLYVRFEGGAAARARCARLLDQFVARFGAAPRLNQPPATGSG
jgi:hypothetical protein